MSRVNFALPDFCSLIPNVPALAGKFLAGLHWKRQRAASRSFKMISFSNINKQYGKQLLFVDASFQLNPGEKVGLVGPNRPVRQRSSGRWSGLWPTFSHFYVQHFHRGCSILAFFLQGWAATLRVLFDFVGAGISDSRPFDSVQDRLFAKNTRRIGAPTVLVMPANI